MKKKALKPFAILTLAAFTMYGCASTDQTADTSGMEGTTMSETTASGGATPDAEERTLDILVVEEQLTVPVITLSVTALPMENTVEIDEMFDDIDDTENYDVLALARKSPNLSTFVKLIEQAGLVDDLQRVEKVSLFAPTNEAFAKMPREKLETMVQSDNIAQLSRMLQTHIIASDVSTMQLRDNHRIRISEESHIPIDTEMAGSVTTVGGARVVKGDIEASNGRIHVIDAVILPSEDIREENPLK